MFIGTWRFANAITAFTVASCRSLTKKIFFVARGSTSWRFNIYEPFAKFDRKRIETFTKMKELLERDCSACNWVNLFYYLSIEGTTTPTFRIVNRDIYIYIYVCSFWFLQKPGRHLRARSFPAWSSALGGYQVNPRLTLLCTQVRPVHFVAGEKGKVYGRKRDGFRCGTRPGENRRGTMTKRPSDVVVTHARMCAPAVGSVRGWTRSVEIASLT